MSEKDKPSCAVSFSPLTNSPPHPCILSLATLTVLRQRIFLLFFNAPPPSCSQITVLVTLHQPLVTVCFSLVLDREYFEECPLCSLYLSQKPAHVGCVQERRESGLCAPPAAFRLCDSISHGLFVVGLAWHIYSGFHLTRCYVIMNILRGSRDSVLIKGQQIIT